MIVKSKILTSLLLVAMFSALCAPAYANDRYASAFTMYPSYTHGGNKAWILHDLKPGDTVEDYLTVENLSSVSGKFKISFFEGFEKGGSVYTQEEGQPENIAALIAPFDKFVELGPGEKQQIKFTYALPRDFGEGEYLGVFYVESLGEEDAGINLRTRIGVRMYTTVSSLAPQAEGFLSPVTNAQKWFFILSSLLLAVTFIWNVLQYKHAR